MAVYDHTLPSVPSRVLGRTMAIWHARNQAPAGTRPRSSLPPGPLRSWMQIALGVVIGAGIPLSGFTPLNNASAVLDISQRPYLVVLMPSVLLVVIALAGAALLPRSTPPTTPALLKLGVVAFLLGGCLSMTIAYSHRDSVLFAITGLVAPIALGWALRRTDVPLGLLAGTFLFVVVVMLVRADVRYVELNGLPTPKNLFTTKFTNSPYDFHYYTLNNPDQTAAFLLLPLTLAAAWGVSVQKRLGRWLLALATVLIAATVMLVYVRFAMAVAFSVLVVALLNMPVRRWIRLATVGVLVIATGAAAAIGNVWHYLSQVTSTGTSATGVVRATSLADGLKEMVHHPFTGAGVGRYGDFTSHVPAHSSLVQAGAELGVAGLIGASLFTLGVLFNVRAVVQRNGWRGLQPAAAIAAAVYWIHASLAGGSDLGLAEGFVSVWGLSLAFACTVGQPVATPQLVLPPLLTRAHTRFSAAWSDLVGSLHDPAKAPTRRRVGAVVGGFAILLVGALVIATRPKSAPPLTPAQRLLDVRFYKALQAPVLSSVPPAAALSLISWDFSHNGNAGWTPVAGAESRQYPGYLSVQTAPAAQSYQFTSGVSTLPPSHYELLLRGRLIAGGMSLGALDVSSNHWTSTASYWYGQSQGHVIDMAVTFTLRATTPLQFILSNLAPRPMRSAWRLTSASLLRIATPHKTSAHATSP
jgi:hypothetical protein